MALTCFRTGVSSHLGSDLVEIGTQIYSASMLDSPSERPPPAEPADLAPQEATEQSGVSLDDLNQAFAELLSPPTNPSNDDEIEEKAAGSDTYQDFDSGPIEPRGILEAMLFVGNENNEPLTVEKATELLRGVSSGEVEKMVQQLNSQYDEDGCPYHITSFGEGYRLELRSEFHRLRDAFHGKIRRGRLSQAAIDVLAIVAYNQPTTRKEIDLLCGRSSGALLAQLVRRQLLSIDRNDDGPKDKVTYYRTTPRFLALFQLENLDDLPRSEDFEKRI